MYSDGQGFKSFHRLGDAKVGEVYSDYHIRLLHFRFRWGLSNESPFLLIIKTMTKEERMLIFPYRDRIKQLIKERNKYKKAYETLLCYFDSISDEEKHKVDKILTKLGLRKN